MSPDVVTVRVAIVVVMLVVTLYDVHLAKDRVEGNTYSEIIREWFLQFRWLAILAAFALGVLMAHWGAS